MLLCEFVPITVFQKGVKTDNRYYIWVNHKLRPEHFEYEGTILRSGTFGLGFQYHEVSDLAEYRKVSNAFRYVTYIKTRLKSPHQPPDCLSILGCGTYASAQFWEDYQAAGLIGLDLGKDNLELMED